MARFRFPVARLPGARRPATAATHENTPRRSRRSLSARAHRPVRSPPRPLPDRHRTKPLPRRRLPRRRSPSPSAPLAAPRCDSRRDAPSSPSRIHLSSSTTHERKRLDAASRNRPHDAEAARRPSPERSRRLRRRPPGARRERGIPRMYARRFPSSAHSRNRTREIAFPGVHVEVAEGSDDRNVRRSDARLTALLPSRSPPCPYAIRR